MINIADALRWNVWLEASALKAIGPFDDEGTQVKGDLCEVRSTMTENSASLLFVR